jgi:hypothetical protein
MMLEMYQLEGVYSKLALLPMHHYWIPDIEIRPVLILD